MTSAELEQVFDTAVKECRALLIGKGHDYSVESDRLSNFNEGAKAAGITPEQVLWVYMHKHQCAIARYCRDGKVDSEGIEGRIHDNIVYLIILLAMVNTKARVSVK